MLADISYLADDELQGRFTLSPELAVAASWIADRYQALGLAPSPGATSSAAGEPASYSVPFALTTGLRVLSPPTLSVARGAGRARAIPASAFSPTELSSTGTASGPLVFVGYAAQAQAPANEEEENTSEQGASAEGEAPLAYDDLAGLDLKGKIAIVLLEAPRRPDVRRFFTLMQEEASSFESAAEPLRAAKDADGLRALHKRSKQRIVAMLAPFMPGEDLDRELWPMPEDALTLKLDLQTMLASLMRKAASLGGPQFGFGEGALTTKVKRLADAGAVGVIAVRGPRSFVTPEDKSKDALPDLKKIRPTASGGATVIPVVQMKWSAADRYLRIGRKNQKISQLQEEIDTALEPRSVSLDGVTASISAQLEPIKSQVPNVLAALP
ncbi:MAG: hypothetical protein KC468_17000, partial [Myxococcales bacterium]|nr:hypothetical protein [Myxococcales bacterium]